MIPLGYPAHNLRFRPDFRLDAAPLPPSNKLLYDRGESHLVTVAPTGSGKGRSAIIPTCLEYPGSLIVLDPKGEAAHVTARARRQLGEVIMLDPFKLITETPDTFNPFGIRSFGSGHVEEQALTFTHALCGDEKSLDDPYWDNKAYEIISGVIAHLLASDPEKRHFPALRDWLYADEPDYRLAVLLDTHKEMNRFAYNAIAAYLQMPSDKTRPCVLSTAQQYLSLLGHPAVAASLLSTSFDLRRLWEGTPITIYLVIPPHKLRSHGSLLRLWIASLLYLLMERETRPDPPTLMIIDECAQLGKLDQLPTAMTLMRGYGLRVWPIFQDLGQLKQLYKHDWATILNNADVLQFFDFRTHLMAKEVAEVVGGRPEDLLRLPPDQLLMCSRGRLDFLQKIDYLKDSQYKGRFDDNPFYPGSSQER